MVSTCKSRQARPVLVAMTLTRLSASIIAPGAIVGASLIDTIPTITTPLAARKNP